MIDALILCGGKGSRVSAILGDTPKFLAPLSSPQDRVADRVIAWLRSHDFIRYVVLAPGLQREKILAARLPVDAIDMWPEATGTADAVRRALKARFQVPALTTDPLLIVNGDTLHDLDLRRPLRIHNISRAAITRVYANDPRGVERPAGLTFFSRPAIESLRANHRADLDDFFNDHPYLIFASNGRYLDTGTPDDLLCASGWGPTTDRQVDAMCQGPVPNAIDVADEPRI